MNSITLLSERLKLLKPTQPGDSITMKITQTGREVLVAKTNGGKDVYSATRYKSGRLHETYTHD